MFDFNPCWSLSIKGGLRLHYVGDVDFGETVRGFFIVQGDRVDKMADEVVDFWEKAKPLIRRFNARQLKKAGKLSAIVLDGPQEASIGSPAIKMMVEAGDQLFFS